VRPRPGLLVVALFIGSAGCAATQEAGTAPPPMPAALAARLDPVLDAVWTGFNRDAARAHVEFAARHWRLAGNAGYNAYVDRIRARLDETGFAGSIRVDEYPLDTPGWDYTVGTLAIALEGGGEEVVLSREQHRVALCINSFSTAPEGVVARLVDVGRGDRAEDYARTDVKGAVVLGDASIGALWRRAVVAGGAIGVVSTTLGGHISPDPPGAPATPRDQWDILQWGSIPYDEGVRGFGFKASPRAAASLRRALAEAGDTPVQVRATVASTFTIAPARTLVAEIPGREAPQERVVLAAHLQEPGANDNASGAATLVEMARALSSAIREGRVPRPARTLTFLWLDEIDGSRRWIADRPDEAVGVRYMFSMDMTGEDVAKTGGTFLIERWPDPGAVWDRPWDPHSEWGRGDVSADSLKGDLINDLHVAVARRVGARTGWDVRTNPYEGGSDHTVFGRAGVPAVLNWHFTDRYYHSNFDTADKTSADEMRNVGVTVAGSSWVLASADDEIALAVGRLVAEAGRARIALETREGAALAAADADPDDARRREADILSAWRRWYREAVDSVSRLVVGAPSDALRAEIRGLAAGFGG
jgi:hypothetical protein